MMIAGRPMTACYRKLCLALDLPGLAQDPRFSTNTARVTNRDS
jgi:crotonobetainyl-CoA:carnitine CoA-transferase CaiB-like acyl-CoA transferase